MGHFSCGQIIYWVAAPIADGNRCSILVGNIEFPVSTQEPLQISGKWADEVVTTTFKNDVLLCIASLQHSFKVDHIKLNNLGDDKCCLLRPIFPAMQRVNEWLVVTSVQAEGGVIYFSVQKPHQHQRSLEPTLRLVEWCRSINHLLDYLGCHQIQH